MKQEFLGWYTSKYFEYSARYLDEIKFGDPKTALKYLQEANTYLRMIEKLEK